MGDTEAFAILMRLTDVLDPLEAASDDLPSNAVIEWALGHYAEKADQIGNFDANTQAYAKVALDAIVALRSALANHLDTAVMQAEAITQQQE